MQRGIGYLATWRLPDEECIGCDAETPGALSKRYLVTVSAHPIPQVRSLVNRAVLVELLGELVVLLLEFLCVVKCLSRIIHIIMNIIPEGTQRARR